MTTNKWAKMPCDWQTNPEFHAQLRVRRVALLGDKESVGEWISALKIYIALCLKANFVKRDSLPDTGCVQRSITQISNLVGVSRPMAIKGLRHLRAWEIVDTRGGRPTIYHIRAYQTCKYWTKLPRAPFQSDTNEKQIEVLRHMSNRSINTLHALQLYLYIASIRDKRTDLAKVTYDHLTKVLCFTRGDISAAISTLIGANLISVRLAGPDEFFGARPSNVYWLRGTFVADDTPGTLQPAA